MISLWVYFIFATTFCIDFTQTEKKYVKVIGDDIYDRIIKYKAKNEIIKMSRNYSNVDKKIWRVLKCKDIEAKEVDNFMTGIRDVRLVSWSFSFSSNFFHFYLEIFLILFSYRSHVVTRGLI